MISTLLGELGKHSSPDGPVFYDGVSYFKLLESSADVEQQYRGDELHQWEHKSSDTEGERGTRPPGTHKGAQLSFGVMRCLQSSTQIFGDLQSNARVLGCKLKTLAQFQSDLV